MLDGMSDSIQRSRIENLHSTEVDRQSPTGLFFTSMTAAVLEVLEWLLTRLKAVTHRHRHSNRTYTCILLVQKLSDYDYRYKFFIMPPAPRIGGIKRWCASEDCLSDVCLSVAYIGHKSRTERPRKTKIGTEVAHVTRDSGTTFKVKRSNCRGAGAYCGGLPHSLF